MTENETNPPAIPNAHEDDPNALSVAQALARIGATIKPVAGTESVALRSALGRITARDIESPVNVPPYPNSAMDGYAVLSADLGADPVSLAVAGTAWAGTPFNDTVRSGQCVRIMTGAKLPAGADTVVMQEDVVREGDRVRIGAGHQQGQNVRHIGEDISQGGVVLPAGRQIVPADLGLLASLGLGEVPVVRRLRVAFFSTGDELRSIGQMLQDGQIYDSNRYTLFGMLQRLGVELLDLGVVGDDRESIASALTQAADIADVVITSGGVSVGDADYVKELLASMGRVDFWKIAMKPGRPLAFGQLGESDFFGLPGNPVSVMATFYQLVQPSLRRMMGCTLDTPLTLRARCTTRLKKRPGRQDFQRGILSRNAEGELTVRTTGPQGSHVLSSMSQANCFIVLAADSGDVSEGTLVDVQPFLGFV